MCIAILKPIGAAISDVALENSFHSNPQGAGYAFVGKKGRMVINKGFFDIKAFIEAYRKDELRYGDSSPALIHFRIATGSNVNEENCHPFQFKHGAFIHNGWFFSSTKEKSDTNLLVESVGEWLTKDKVLVHKEELAKHFGHNKVILLYRDKSTVILNEDAGVWDNGVWYSNTSFRRGVVSRVPGPTTSTTAAAAAANGVGVAYRRSRDLDLPEEELFSDEDFNFCGINGMGSSN